MNTTNLILGIALVICGGVIGYNLKKCDPIISEIKTIDTVYQSYPIYDTFKISYPKNVVIEKTKIETKYVHDTTIKNIFNEGSFTSIDTLSHDGIKVAILDKGNCNGIYSRSSLFFGTQNEKVVTQTIEKVVQKQHQLFTIMAGVSASFSNKWNAFDVAPAASVNIKNKFYIGYSYGINTSTHNLSLQTKIK